MLHGMGREFGSTTGRARRCGWFDAVATRFARMVNGIDSLAVTNVDGLDTLETLRICVGYRLDGAVIEVPPCGHEAFARCEPVYEEMPGWMHSTGEARTYGDLPLAARRYLRRICELTGAKLGMVSVGPGRDQTIRVS
jgi:adenylosuccinate synthase